MSTLIEVMLCKFHGDNSSSDIFQRMSSVLLIGKFLCDDEIISLNDEVTS